MNRIFFTILLLSAISYLSACNGNSTDKPPCPNSMPGSQCPDEPKDSDNDGIVDTDDQCPMTQTGATVDAKGCSNLQLDLDQDGILNEADRCADTKSDENVNLDGCAIDQMVVVETFGINSAGEEYFSNSGTRYIADRFFSSGRVASRTTPVANTEDDLLFNTIRYDRSFSYSIPAKSGSYRIRIHLNEIAFDAINKRLFDVFAEEQKVLSRIDIFQLAASKNTAFNQDFGLLNVEGANIDIEFTSLIDNASISGILLERLAAPIDDDDQDGVVNSQDKCFNTPPNSPVDIEGCPTESATISTIQLINAQNDLVISELTNNMTVDLADVPDRALTISALASPITQSVLFEWGNNQRFIANDKPFAIAGLAGDNDFKPWAPAAGEYQLIITPYTGLNVAGVQGTAQTILFTVIDSSVIPGENATYHGKKDFVSFNNGTIPEFAWSLDPIVFYTWDNITQQNADRWLGWYKQCNELYELVLNRDAHLENDPNFGRKKVLAVVDAIPMLCGSVNAAGCGNKFKAQASRGFATSVANNPESPLPHWILLYEMGRGGFSEAFYKKGIWPKNGWDSGMPHTMAGVCFHEIGGDTVLESTSSTPGRLLQKLDSWEKETLKFHETFVNGSAMGYIPHDLMAAIMYRILQQESPTAIRNIFLEIAKKPERDNAKAAMCDFVNSVNSVTNNSLNQRLIGPWGMPSDC